MGERDDSDLFIYWSLRSLSTRSDKGIRDGRDVWSYLVCPVDADCDELVTWCCIPLSWEDETEQDRIARFDAVFRNDSTRKNSTP